eukprot:m.164306 g.164306  ORF g.164306 m.164306 type:complete len:78 (+) comp23936_c0_seq3:2549-2782(+)
MKGSYRSKTITLVPSFAYSIGSGRFSRAPSAPPLNDGWWHRRRHTVEDERVGVAAVEPVVESTVHQVALPLVLAGLE